MKIILWQCYQPECGGADGHDGGDQSVDLSEWGILYVEPVGGDAVQSGVVEHNHAVCWLGKPLECEQGVVWLHDDVANLVLVRKHAVRLY